MLHGDFIGGLLLCLRHDPITSLRILDCDNSVLFRFSSGISSRQAENRKKMWTIEQSG